MDASMSPGDSRTGIMPMPPEFQLIHARRVRCSGRATQPDGQAFHFTGYEVLTPEDEDWYRLNAPERGLHDDDLRAFRASARKPVEFLQMNPGPLTRFIARLKFWT